MSSNFNLGRIAHFSVGNFQAFYLVVYEMSLLRIRDNPVPSDTLGNVCGK